jgi:hypothetical protein
MKMQIKQLLALLVVTACFHLPGYAAPKHDHLYNADCGIFKVAPPFTYWIHTTYEYNIVTTDTYIEYKTFRVYYSAPLPYNVTISYNVYHSDTNNGDSNIEYFAYGSQGTTATYLGFYETYYNGPDYFSTTDLSLNYVHQE